MVVLTAALGIVAARVVVTVADRVEDIVARRVAGSVSDHNLHAFNLAMLDKQGWKFVTNPSALVNRVFKTKYFLRGIF